MAEPRSLTWSADEPKVLSKRDVLRCLKRFIAREVCHDLRADLTPATPGRTPMPMSG
jgi:hypothetical protein